MRVISQDRKTNVPYEPNVFCLIADNDNENYCVAVRNPNLTGFMPLAEYATEKAAQIAFDELITAGERNIVPNGTFEFK